MLHVTDAAVSALKTEVLSEGEALQGSTATAVRIGTRMKDDGQEAITLQPVTGPEPGDTPTEAADLDVFVAPELAGSLDTAVLDAEQTPEGPAIVLRAQPDQG